MAAMMEIDSKCIGGVPSVDGATRTVVDTSGGSQFSVDLLSQYYRRLFPAQELFRWLSYGNDPDRAAEDSSISADFFARREFASLSVSFKIFGAWFVHVFVSLLCC